MNRETDTLLVEDLRFDTDGLIPVIIQSEMDQEVLMVAWMDNEALTRTLATGDVWFYSRSRGRYWRKGEESGNTLRAKDVRYDCDGDAILITCSIKGAGVACHTGERSCFYRSLPLRGDADDE